MDSHTADGYSEREIAAIEAVVAELERAQQTELPDEFVSPFRADAVWTTAHGKRLTGRDEIEEFTPRVLPGAMRASTARYEVSHVAFVRPDAVVQIRQHPITHGGMPISDEPEGRPMYIMAKEEGVWKIVAGQNTHVRVPERSPSPAPPSTAARRTRR